MIRLSLLLLEFGDFEVTSIGDLYAHVEGIGDVLARHPRIVEHREFGF